MVTVVDVDLTGRLTGFAPLEFVCAQTWWQSPRFVLLTYTMNGAEVIQGVRLDLDKKAILDETGEPAVDAMIQARRVEIWEAVIQALAYRLLLP